MAEPWPNLSPSHILQVESGWPIYMLLSSEVQSVVFQSLVIHTSLGVQIPPPSLLHMHLPTVYTFNMCIHTYIHIHKLSVHMLMQTHTWTPTHSHTHPQGQDHPHIHTRTAFSLSLSLQLALIVAQSREPGGHLSGIKLSALSNGLQRVAKVARRMKGEWVCERRGLLKDSKNFFGLQEMRSILQIICSCKLLTSFPNLWLPFRYSPHEKAG